MSDKSQVDVAALSRLMQLEAMARKAESLKALQFLIVNESRRVISFRQAFVFTQQSRHKFSLQAASSIAVLEKDAPFVRWLEKFLAQYSSAHSLGNAQFIDKASCPEALKPEWDEYSLAHVMWVPLKNSEQTIGGIWLARENPWGQPDMTLAKRLSETYAHAWKYFLRDSRFSLSGSFKKSVYLVFVLILIIVMLIPVRLSALAPVEVVAKNPVLVTSPMEGVIADIKVAPNSLVTAGQLLFVYEDTVLRNQHLIAEKTLAVKQAEYKKAKQGAFRDNKSKAQIALLKTEVELAESELNYAAELLARIHVSAVQNGLLIYSNKDDWIGKPVQVGERIMQIANPEQMELRIDLPVEDAIALSEGAEVDVFLDIDPLRPLGAKVKYNSYRASLTARDVLAYTVNASFNQSYKDIRIGLQGTAKVYGEEVSLFFYLFRRPIATVRQYLGL